MVRVVDIFVPAQLVMFKGLQTLRGIRIRVRRVRVEVRIF